MIVYINKTASNQTLHRALFRLASGLHSQSVCQPSSASERGRYAVLGGRRNLMSTMIYLAVLLLAVPLAAAAGIFGEGYSSAEPGAPSALHFRTFTIYTLQEACRKSPVPAGLRIFPNPLRMSVGDRIHRSNVSEHPSELVIEAYDKNGAFLPAVPVVVNTLEVSNVVGSRSDWDYFEALREGEDELAVFWACAPPDGTPVEARVRIIVTSRTAEVVD